MSVLRVEGSVFNKIHATADHIACGERGPVRLARSGWTKAVPIVAMVTVGVFVPTWQPVHVNAMGGQAYSHVTVPAFTNDLHLEVIEAAGCRYGMRCAHTCRILVGFPVTWGAKIFRKLLEIRRKLLRSSSGFDASLLVLFSFH